MSIYVRLLHSNLRLSHSIPASKWHKHGGTLWSLILFATMGVFVGGGETGKNDIEKSAPPSDKERLDKAKLTVEQMFSADFEQATSSAKRQKLARQLLDNAPRIKDDIEVRYAMLIEGREQAIAAGHFGLTVEAVDLLAKYFKLDAIVLKTDALEQLSKKTREANVHREIVPAAVALAKSATEESRFDDADRLVLIALVSARKTKNAKLIGQVNTAMLDIAAAKKRVKGK